jgi:hypothetical protein
MRGAGRAVFAATLLAIVGAIGALLSIGGAYPWWSLGILFLCIYVIHGIFTLGEDERVARP